eukprot:365443-Chlamydomonas_euryale.AAC.25
MCVRPDSKSESGVRLHKLSRPQPMRLCAQTSAHAVVCPDLSPCGCVPRPQPMQLCAQTSAHAAVCPDLGPCGSVFRPQPMRLCAQTSAHAAVCSDLSPCGCVPRPQPMRLCVQTSAHAVVCPDLGPCGCVSSLWPMRLRVQPLAHAAARPALGPCHGCMQCGSADGFLAMPGAASCVSSRAMKHAHTILLEAQVHSILPNTPPGPCHGTARTCHRNNASAPIKPCTYEEHDDSFIRYDPW